MQQITEEQRKVLEEQLKNMGPEELKEFQKQQCIFCQIIAGNVPSKKIYEDEKCIAIMDINPAAIGHVLLLPKEHYAIMPQVLEETVGHMFMVAKHLSQAMLRKLKVEGTNIFAANGTTAGQKAQHFMIHVIPRKERDGVLEVSEHLVDEAVREKLGGIIRNKINELLGVKKEKKTEEEKKAMVEEKKGEEEEVPLVRRPSSEKAVKKKEKAEEKGGEEKREVEKKKEEDEEADLDDIAELFK